MSSETITNNTPNDPPPANVTVDSSSPTIESSIELAKKAAALGKTEEVVTHYATALELMQEKYGESAPESADLLFAYGKALLENAIVQNAVLGKEEPNEAEDDDEEEDSLNVNGKTFVFGGDGVADDTDEEETDAPAEDKVLDLKKDPIPGEEQDGEAGRDGAGDNEEEDAPEDDFNAAWEVLDLARAFFDKMDDDASKLKLADCYVALGDISLETEKFEQAITDFTSGLELKTKLLPLYSREIAEVHWKLSMVLDLTSGRLGDAVQHVEQAIASMEARSQILQDAIDGKLIKVGDAVIDTKGKGKESSGASLPFNDPITKMSPEQLAAELKDVNELKGELLNKLDDLRTAPEQLDQRTSTTLSAPELAAQQLSNELGSTGSSSLANVQVNDLSAMVKKKKKPAPAPATTEANAPAPTANGNAKRKAEDEAESVPEEKRMKIDS